MRQFAFDLTLIVLESAGGRFEAGHKPVFLFKNMKYGIKYMTSPPDTFAGYNSEWIGIIYDDEKYSDDLAEGIPTMLRLTKADVVSCFKKNEEGNPTIMPRFYRSGVVLKPGTMIPQAGGMLSYDKLLNGFILER